MSCGLIQCISIDKKTMDITFEVTQEDGNQDAVTKVKTLLANFHAHRLIL